MRRALRGYAGDVPKTIAVGDTIDVLNLGGILGRCTSANPEIGPPFQAEVLGAVLAFPELGDRIGRPAHIRDRAVPPAETLSCDIPVVFIAGTCMNAGKTVAATELVRGLARGGLRVAATKLTGVSLMRDALSMQDAGRGRGADVQRCRRGEHARRDDGADRARALQSAGRSARSAPRRDRRRARRRHPRRVRRAGHPARQDLMALGAAYVMAAPDPVGCWGAREIMRDEFNLPITAITGPATDNDVGRDYITASLGLPAFNARRDPEGLVAAVRVALEQWHAAHGVRA